MMQNEAFAKDLGTEVWYRVEVSPVIEEDWNAASSDTFDSMDSAVSWIERWAVLDKGYTYRIVRVTTKTELVSRLLEATR